MQFVRFFSHAEALHSESTSELVHILTSTPVALALYIAGLGIMWLVMKSMQKTRIFVPATFAYNFIAGIASFSVVPAVSVIAITLGIGSALVFTLSSIASEN